MSDRLAALTDTTHWSVSSTPSLALIRARLPVVFPPGLDYRSEATAERAARSVFVFLYVFAVEGVSGNRLRPAMVTSMSDTQAELLTPSQRITWWNAARRPRRQSEAVAGRWYAENTREPIRDETFRAWKEHGALLEDQLPTASAAPRYQLARDFADLFDPALDGQLLAGVVAQWQARHLTSVARARLALRRQQDVTVAGTSVRFPDGSARTIALGPSTPLVRAVIEQFVPVFLRSPVVLAVTESRQRLAYDDRQQLTRLGLKPEERLMPDVLLADLDGPGHDLRLVFLECVATGGPMSGARVRDLRVWLARNDLGNIPAAFGSVFADRGDAAFRRYAGALAWETFAWFTTEPANIVVLLEQGHYDALSTLDSVTF